MDNRSTDNHRVRPGVLVVGILIILSAGLTATATQVDLPKANQRWIEVQTAHFRFFSNAGTGATKRVAADLEELRAVLAQLTTFELQSPVPTYIYVFKHDRSFTPYKILYEDEPGVMSGYFFNQEPANYIAIDAGSRDASGIVFHEYVHYIEANNFWWLPVWLSEGLAGFYQTFRVIDDTAYIGLPINRHLATLRGSTRIPLAELLAVDHVSPLYNEKYRKGDFYAQSWALTHYLLLGNEGRRQQLGDFLTAIRRGVEAETAFADAFGPDFDGMDREVRGHIRNPRFRFLQSKTEINVDDSVTVREMSYADVLFRLGDLLKIQQPVRSEATSYFEAALEADPNHSPSLTAVALAAEEHADWEAAASAYTRAIEADPNDSMALFYWGTYLSHRPGDPMKAVAALTRATQLRPSFAPAWIALSSHYVKLGNTSPEALEAAETAHRLEPANEGATHSLLRLYVRLDRREQAINLIENSLQSNRRTSGEAWMAVLHNDLLRARELLQEERSAASLARLDAAEEDSAQAARPAIIERGIADVRRSVSEHQGAKTYYRAVAVFEEGDPETARAILEQALLQLPAEGPVAVSCRRLIDAIDHPEKYTQPEPQVISPSLSEIDELNRMLAARDFEGAIGFLQTIRRNSAGKQTRWIDGKIRELQNTIDYNRYVENYNRAVDLYNRQDYVAVVTILDELLAILPDGPQATSARALRNDAQAAIDE